MSNENELTKRERIAAMLMQGILASGFRPNQAPDASALAVENADALLAELAKTQP